jgi:hypothetical protein
MLHAWLFLDVTQSLVLPTEIEKLTIDMRQHILYLQSLDMNEERGEFQTCFFYVGGRDCIDSISF